MELSYRQDQGRHHEHVRLLYLRTKLALRNSTDVIERLGKAVAEKRATSQSPFALLLLGQKSLHWNDGCVLRFYSTDTPQEICDLWAEGLSHFDAWAMHDAHGAWCEYPKNGLMTRYYQRIDEMSTFDEPHQLYLMARPGMSCDGIAVKVRDKMRSALSLPVFHFEGGQVVFSLSNEAAKLASRRLEREIADLAGLAAYDCDGTSFACNGTGEEMWKYWEFETCEFDEEKGRLICRWDLPFPTIEELYRSEKL